MERGYRLAVMIYLTMTSTVLTACVAGELPRCEMQPSGINLNTNGKSSIFWVFDQPQSKDEWVLRGGPGSFVAGNSFGHCGDDYYANDWVRKDGNQEGQSVYAGISGIAYTSYYPNTWGKEVIIYNSDYKFALRYAHLSWYDESLNGKWINAASDTPIGKIGKTGLGTGPHLHLVLYKNVDSIDDGNPVRYSSCAVENDECAKSATNYAAQFSFNPRPTMQSSPFTVPTSDKLDNYIQILTDKDSEVRRTATDALDYLDSQTQTGAENEVRTTLRGILENVGIPPMWINYLLP